MGHLPILRTASERSLSVRVRASITQVCEQGRTRRRPPCSHLPGEGRPLPAGYRPLLEFPFGKSQNSGAATAVSDSGHARSGYRAPVAQLVSVIVPVHNGEQHVEQGVRSALGQTYEDLEVIVVDDGSTDGTRAVLDRIVDDRLRVLHQPNARVAAAYNRGVEAASGPILAFLDHDDEWLPRKLEVQVPYLRSSGAGVVGTMMQYMGTDGHLIGGYFGESTEGRQQ